MNSIKKFIFDETGVTAIEYALIAALIAVGIILSVDTLSTGLSATFDRIRVALAAAGT